jgi:hypothetical protein
MEYKKLRGLALVAVIYCLAPSCQNNNSQEEEDVARKYCSSCHLFPEASLLDKKTWISGVLPAMRKQLGISSTVHGVSFNGAITEAEWNKINNYYLKNAPDSMTARPFEGFEYLRNFNPETIRIINQNPIVTLLHADNTRNLLYVGTRISTLYVLDNKLQVKDSFHLPSPPSQLLIKDKLYLLLMGLMDPNDQTMGQLITIDKKDGTDVLIDSLRRPVYFEHADLNMDGRQDFIICSFGNTLGDLSIFEKLKSGGYKKHILSNEPGARKVILSDYDSDGSLDILALLTQGDEKIVLLKNLGNFKFTSDTLLRFPPVYGSSYIEVHDFNNDGHFDILYTNGDNADFSPILKPYHGIRIFLNDGMNKFSEKVFFSMYGASQTIAFDFDNDGDLDIAAIGFFSDHGEQSTNGFLYLENTGDDYLPGIIPLAESGRWIVMESSDLDGDGDLDIVLGALAFHSHVPDGIYASWLQDKVSLLVLRNQSVSK